jgi:hypothetical protein
MPRRLLAAVCGAALVLSVGASSVLAGEVTGNGRLLHVDTSTGLHGHSACAYSGQEDLQFFVTDEDLVRVGTVVRGVPSHAQSWGQIPHAVRIQLTAIGMNPGIACNPQKATAPAP